MLFQSVLLVAFMAGALTTGVRASSCLVFDASWNLYVFNLGNNDYSLGPQGNLQSGSATRLTASGNRPPFTGNNMQCFLSQFEDSIYILGADANNLTNVFIFNAATPGWSTQTTDIAQAPGIDLTNIPAILDHDTNVFFALSNGTLYQADFGTQKTATSEIIHWQTVGTPSFSTNNYAPVMALAQNHIHFLDVPGAPAGEAYIFVIHFAYFQPTPQSYPATSGNTFPATHGLTASIFDSNNLVQQRFAFIPDDGSGTYLINVETNTTTNFAAPPNTTTGAVYTASDSILVRLSDSGEFSYLDVSSNAPSNTPWTALHFSNLTAVTTTSTTTGSTKSGARSSSTGSVTFTSTQTASTATHTTGGAIVNSVSFGASVFAMFAMLFVI